MGINEYNLNVILLGAPSVGKTCIIKKWTVDQFTDEYIPTKKVTDYKVVEVNGRTCKVEILDTAGICQYWGMRDNYIQEADGIIIVFSIVDQHSFETLNGLQTQVSRNIKPDSCCIVIGNKYDLRESRDTSYDTAYKFAEEHKMTYIETSARSGHNINDAFNQLLQEIIEKRKTIRQENKKDKSCSVM